MPSGEERARDAALLAYLREPMTERAQDDQEVQEVRANLLRGVLPRRPPRTDDAFVRALLPRNRRATGPDWQEARSAARDWRNAGATAEEVGAWLAAGAYPEEGALVALLMREGITVQRAGPRVPAPGHRRAGDDPRRSPRRDVCQAVGHRQPVPRPGRGTDRAAAAVRCDDAASEERVIPANSDARKTSDPGRTVRP